MTFERDLYDPAYSEGLPPHHWFKNPPRKYAERNRDVLRLLEPKSCDRLVELDLVDAVEADELVVPAANT